MDAGGDSTDDGDVNSNLPAQYLCLCVLAQQPVSDAVVTITVQVNTSVCVSCLHALQCACLHSTNQFSPLHTHSPRWSHCVSML